MSETAQVAELAGLQIGFDAGLGFPRGYGNPLRPPTKTEKRAT